MKKNLQAENSSNDNYLTNVKETLCGFAARHIGLSADDINHMLDTLGYKDIDVFTEAVVPKNILNNDLPDIGEPLSEQSALKKLKEIAKKNVVVKSMIGQGYYSGYMPNVIKRNVFENPGWYTSYTPYQAEISQGRLEALINFQTMVADLTNLDIANASLLDEPTAAAEAMTLAHRSSKSKSDTFLVDKNCFPQTISIVKARAKPLGINVEVVDLKEFDANEAFGALFQYPGNDGSVEISTELLAPLKDKGIITIAATDLLALTLIKAPGDLGFDIAIGNSQRFGVPLGFGGPHAAFMAANEKFKRSLPGRLIGASVDKLGNTSYRLSLQTREQHIRREKATSNICTAQALLAIIAGFYAVYHGPRGLKNIALSINKKTESLANFLIESGYEILSSSFFDTLVINTKDKTEEIIDAAELAGYGFRKFDNDHVALSIDETTEKEDLIIIREIFKNEKQTKIKSKLNSIPAYIKRESDYLTHPVFNTYFTETELLRYIRKLSDKDIALDRAMIPLGSCTMKLNATSEMIPVGWEEFSSIHPYAPEHQVKGYLRLIDDLEQMLEKITGYSAISLQPNAGSQGEYAGLLAIDAFHKSNGHRNRKVCLIPESAHGTNPASAQMAGMKVVPVKCDKSGNIDLDDLQDKANNNSEELAGIMITYPSTHGVFEETVTEVCNVIHSHGGKVYIDGANLNAMVSLCKPGLFGGDVSHLNLHKTFCIPHGGGGPGVGPIGVVEELSDYLPSDPLTYSDQNTTGPISASNFGSASILPISWMYIQMMGSQALRLATQVAILSANYIAHKLKKHYAILYTGQNDMIAHECIIDIRPLKESIGIEVDDIAKRLVDFGFHAPTMSFPVPGTLMIEPTESESLKEIDRFCDAMIEIRNEISEIENGDYPLDDNVLKHAPHSAEEVTSDNWEHTYSREKAVYPLKYLKKSKYWVPVSRIDNVHGDRNLMCSCPSIKDFE
jgi:glycine dehydrogenase